MPNKTFKKKDFVEFIHANMGFSKNISDKIVNDLFETLVQTLKKEQIIKITSFGTFKKRFKNERIGRNPKTKNNVKISARNVITFKGSKLLKKKLNY